MEGRLDCHSVDEATLNAFIHNPLRYDLSYSALVWTVQFLIMTNSSTTLRSLLSRNFHESVVLLTASVLKPKLS
jgi:hypothetical protein